MAKKLVPVEKDDALLAGRKIYSSGGSPYKLNYFRVVWPNLPTSSGPISTIGRSGPDCFTQFESYNIAGWDGDQASPIRAEAIATARTLNSLLPRMPIPDIAPGPTGVVGFEWRGHSRNGNYYLLIEVASDTEIVVRLLYSSRGKYWYIHHFRPWDRQSN